MAHKERDEELESLISDLVALETENPPGNERRCAEYIHSWFQDRDIETQLVHEPEAERPQVVAEVGDGDPVVVLNGHIDVVPAGDDSEWTNDPYEPTVDDGKLYGRGSVDMKAGVAIAMLTLERFSQDGADGDRTGTIRFHAAMGEETGEPGTKVLLEEGFGGDYGVILEPTGLETAIKTKGTAWYRITVRGNPSHASRPYQGTNAIANAQLVYDRLAEFGEEVQEREDELLGSAYATVTQFNAGTKENVIPESATIVVDRRVLPSEDFESVHGEIESLLDEVRSEHDIEVEMEVTRTYEPSETPADSELVDVFRERSSSMAGIPNTEFAIPAATDTRNFINDAGIDAITWGPGDIEQAHTYDEHIDLTEAATGLEILEAAVGDLLDVPSEES